MNPQWESLIGGLNADIADAFNRFASNPSSAAAGHIESDKISSIIEAAFFAARRVKFEHGMSNEFHHRLISAIQTYGAPAISAIGDLIFRKTTNPEVASMALQYLGGVEQPTTYIKRLTILVRALKHPSAEVKEGAVLGIDLMGEPAAIPYLIAAIEQERDLSLRKDMQVVLSQLKR